MSAVDAARMPALRGRRRTAAADDEQRTLDPGGGRDDEDGRQRRGAQLDHGLCPPPHPCGGASRAPAATRVRGKMKPTMKPPFRVMGVVNVTPDSFSDGGRYLDARRRDRARPRAAGEGADLLDVGGESTRPGRGAGRRRGGDRARRCRSSRRSPAHARGVDRHDEGRASRAPRSPPARRTSTTSARCASTPSSAGVVADAGVDCCLMHMRGEPRTMQDDPRYDDVVADVKAHLEERIAFAVGAGHRRGAHPRRPRHRVRQDRSSTTSSCCAASTRSSRSAGPSSSARRASRSSAG